jgi:hypothetical protein
LITGVFPFLLLSKATQSVILVSIRFTHCKLFLYDSCIHLIFWMNGAQGICGCIKTMLLVALRRAFCTLSPQKHP